MKTRILLFFLLSLTAFAATATYQCPMHPWIKSTHAGDKCTICGMTLVASSKSANDDGAATTGSSAVDDANLVTLGPAASSVVGLRTAEVTRGTLVRTLRVTGVIDDDDTKHRILAARVPGRVEKLFVNYVGAEVRSGEPLATVYSPEMLTAQRQYVERMRASGAFPESERAGARERLLDLGLTDEEVSILEHTLEPTAMVTVRAPISGTVVARHVYEGQEINKDQSEKETRLFEIADFSSMWFVFDAYEADLAWLRVGQQVEISTASLAGQTLTAPIAFIDPNLNEMTRTAKVRVVVPNQNHQLFHKQTAAGLVRLEVPEVLSTPRSAVLQHGGEPIVFVEQRAHGYLARRVRLGRIGDARVEILAGLNPGDRVVAEGALLLDGQAQLARAAITGDIGVQDAKMPASASPVETFSSKTPAELIALAATSADAAQALAADDFGAYQKILPNLRTQLGRFLETDAVKNALGEFEKALPDRNDLRSARRDFEPFSTAVADLLRSRPASERGDLHVFQCPMAPVLGIGRWVGRTPEVRNPFFGSAMPVCGEELK